MKLIVWLWNPWKEYENTRHNAGFLFLDWLKNELQIPKEFEDTPKMKAQSLETTWNWEKTVFLKPQTYMNLSGESVLKMMSFYKIPKENIIVIFDDISLEPWKIRFRESGSSGGQNGIKHIISQIGEDFKRIKIGIWLNPKWQVTDWVLGKLTSEEQDHLEKHSFPEVLKLIEKHF